MTRGDEAEWWFNAVYAAVQEIPPGSVTSYGHIARLLGRRKLNHVLVALVTICCAMRLTLFLNQAQCPRQVGICLKHLPSSSAHTQHHFHDANVPWQRVINAKGVISPRGPGGAARQAAFLRREGVTVESGPLGELTVKLEIYGWFPDLLPSEGAEASESEEEERSG